MTSPDEPLAPPEDSQPEAAPEASGPLRRYWLWFALAAAVAVAGIIAAIIPGTGTGTGAGTAAGAGAGAGTATAGASNGDGTGAGSAGASGAAAASSASASPGATGTAQAAGPAPAAVTSLSHLPPKLADSLVRWDSGRGGTALAAVTGDLGAATQSAAFKNYSPMKTACTNLAPAVASAKAGPPIPDAAMQRRYSAALASLASAAADCEAAISVHSYGEGAQTRENPAVLHRSLSELATGARQLYLATGELNNLKHH
jgi:hypothetical protein